MTELRFRPGDLAIVIHANNSVNLGRIVRVVRMGQGRGILSYPDDKPSWLTESAHLMTWFVNKKKVERKRGPIPDAQLQPIRGFPPGREIAESLTDLADILKSCLIEE